MHMKIKFSLLVAAALCVAAACSHDNSNDNSDNGPAALAGGFVPFKTFVEHYTAPEGDGQVVVTAKFDAQGRTTGFTLSDGDYRSNVEVTYGANNSFTVVDENGRMEGQLANGLLKKADVTWDGAPYRVSAEYDADGHVSTYSSSYADGSSNVDRFTWEDGNLTGYTSTYTDSKGASSSYRFVYEYSDLENRSGLAALMAYPDDFFSYHMGFLLGTAFTKNVPERKMSFNGTDDEMDYGVEYTDFKTDSNGLVTSFVRRGLTEYSGDDFTYTLTY